MTSKIQVLSVEEDLLSGIFGDNGLSPNFTVSEVTPPEPPLTGMTIIPIAIGVACVLILYKLG